MYIGCHSSFSNAPTLSAPNTPNSERRPVERFSDFSTNSSLNRSDFRDEKQRGKKVGNLLKNSPKKANKCTEYFLRQFYFSQCFKTDCAGNRLVCPKMTCATLVTLAWMETVSVTDFCSRRATKMTTDATSRKMWFQPTVGIFCMCTFLLQTWSLYEGFESNAGLPKFPVSLARAKVRTKVLQPPPRPPKKILSSTTSLQNGRLLTNDSLSPESDTSILYFFQQGNQSINLVFCCCKAKFNERASPNSSGSLLDEVFDELNSRDQLFTAVPVVNVSSKDTQSTLAVTQKGQWKIRCVSKHVFSD